MQSPPPPSVPATPAALTPIDRSLRPDSPPAAPPLPIAPRRPLLTYLILSGAAGFLLYASLTWLPGQAPALSPSPPPLVVPPPLPVAVSRPQVEVVFVLDTTGSMSALLDGAKRKIWEIARFIAQGQPAPELRIGLVAYRDLGDDYVTKFFDLTDDLDGVYQNLAALQAGGGGDTPEHVAKGLHEAVFQATWSSSPRALKVIYLVGDAPPHTDYSDGYKIQTIAAQAHSRGIRINTVRCGSDDDTRVAWSDLAQRTGGEFVSLEQSGGMVSRATPFDSELARLNRDLSNSALPYGQAEKQRQTIAKARQSLEAPAAAQADRAGLFGLLSRRGRLAAVSDGDLLDDLASKRVTLDSVEAAALPAPLQGLGSEERSRYLDAKKKERSELLHQIDSLSQQRDAYLRAAPQAPAASFDGQLRESLKKQAKDIDVAY